MLMKINIKDPLPSGIEILIFYYVKDKYFYPLPRTASRCPFSFALATGATQPPVPVQA